MSEGIVLIGLPGSGKSAVGKVVAERLGRPFVDIDTEIERAVGASSADVLARDGEPHLRELERKAVESAVRTRGAVIATGGGTVIDPLNRWLLMEHGLRVRLEAPIDRLASRLRADATNRRPLLGQDLEDGLRRTAAERSAVYAAVDAIVDAAGDVGLTADGVLDACRTWNPDGWRPLFDTGFNRHHPIGPTVGRLLSGRGMDGRVLGDLLSGQPAFVVDRKAPVVVERNERTLEIDGGEQSKSMAQLERLLAWLSELQLERSDPLVVIGGGTVGDVGGLAAALHRRGVPLVYVPTTWLAQADSSIGGKVAVDLPGAKNGVGAFWPPTLVVDDADFIASLPVERRRDGIAECLKAGLIADPVLWQLVEERGREAVEGDDPGADYAITERAIKVKLDVVDRDPFETGERRKLNLGHTIGHALEIESGYSLAHGEAVALGLRAVTRIAAGRHADADLSERIDTVLTGLGFPRRRSFDRSAVIAALSGDKKREAGEQRWILPIAVCDVAEVSDVTAVELDNALDAISL
jgi:shikimate kinase/3-dehydroquinate synthase